MIKILFYSVVISLTLAQHVLNENQDVLRLSQWEFIDGQYETELTVTQFQEYVYGLLFYPMAGQSIIKLNDEIIFDNQNATRFFRSKLIYLSPKNLKQNNRLSIRFMQQKDDQKMMVSYMQFGKYSNLSERFNQSDTNNLIKIGIFITAFIVALSLYIGFNFFNSYLFLMFFSLSQLTEFGFNMYSQINPLPIGIISYLKEFYTGINMIHGITLTLFLITFFDMKKLNLWIYACITLHIITITISETSNIYGNLVFAMVISMIAMKEHKRGSLLILSGLVLFLLLATSAHFRIITYGFSIGVIGLIFMMILAISQKLNEQTERIKNLESKSIKLESEILRQNIQPHFIMNTLQSIIAWIHKDPKIAINQIEALSEEFTNVNEVAQKPLITVAQEIALCRNYLTLMSYRKNVKYSLEINGVNDEKMIPPMIFHTLIENGITHAVKKRAENIFSIMYIENELEEIYQIQNATSPQISDQIEEGLGYTYIKNRLEDAYPGKWELTYQAVNDLWQTQIRISK